MRNEKAFLTINYNNKQKYVCSMHYMLNGGWNTNLKKFE